MSVIPPTPDLTTRPPLPEPPAPSLHPPPTRLSPASPTAQEPSTAHALLAPSVSSPTNRSTNAGTSSTTGVAHNAPHIPPAVTFSGVPYVDASHSVFYQAGGDIHIYPPANGARTLLVYILYSHLIDQCSIAFEQPPRRPTGNTMYRTSLCHATTSCSPAASVIWRHCGSTSFCGIVPFQEGLSLCMEWEVPERLRSA